MNSKSKRVIYLLFILSLLQFATTSAGETYPVPTINSCSKDDMKQIKDAFNKVKDTVDNSSCLPSNIKKKVKPKLSKPIIISCRTNDYAACKESNGDLNCGAAPINGTIINICPSAFDPAACGCLQSLHLHELLHAVGYTGEKVPQGCEASCFSDCAKTDPKYPACDCK